MPSLTYRITERLIALSGARRMMAKEGEAFSKMIMKMGRKQSVRVPRSINKKCDLSEGKIGKHRYFVISKKDAKPRRAVLYLFGGGYVLPPDKGDFLFAVETAEATDAEVWFPVYPLLPRYKLVDAVRMVMEIYGMMLERFPAEQITFIGFSSGAALACSVCIQNKQEGFRYPMPSSLILVSSGTQLPPSGEQMREMERLAPKDPMIPPSFFQNIGPLLAAQEDRYLLSPALYDLTGFPKLVLYYGTHEVMLAFLPAMQAAAGRANVEYTVHIGEGLCHCWPMLGFTKEGRQSREEIYSSVVEPRKSHAALTGGMNQEGTGKA